MEINITPFSLEGEFLGLGDHTAFVFRNDNPRNILIQLHKTPDRKSTR